jgi:heat shock protein HtpX
MELCVDNPREGFDNLFDTHPSVDSRVAALVQFARGHDPGPIALPIPVKPPGNDEDEAEAQLQASKEWKARTGPDNAEDNTLTGGVSNGAIPGSGDLRR